MHSSLPRTIDLNCDIGEGFGPYCFGNDAALLEQVTSANIACGFHAGDCGTMYRTVRLCQERNVAIGAHPGLPDRLSFGRRRWDLAAHEAYEFVVYQLGALSGFVRTAGAELRHVKPHGALYNMASQDAELAAALAQAVFDFDRKLVLYGLAGSQLVQAGAAIGLRVAREAFADRAYENDGTLASRDQAASHSFGGERSVEQALNIVVNQQVISCRGVQLSIQADTICIHGDQAHAVDSARAIRQALEQYGVRLQSLNSNGEAWEGG